MRLNIYIIIVLVELVLPSWQHDSSEDINELLNKLNVQTNNETVLNNKQEQPDDDSKIIIVETFREPIAKDEPKNQRNNVKNVLNEDNQGTRTNFGSDPNNKQTEVDDYNILQEIIIEVERVEDSERMEDQNGEDKTKKLLGEFLSKTGRAALDDNNHTKQTNVFSNEDILHKFSPASTLDENISNDSKTDEIKSVLGNRSVRPVINDYVSNKDVATLGLNNDYYQTNHKDIPRVNLRLPINKLIEKILQKKSLRTDHSISRQGNARYVPPQNPIPLPVAQKPQFRIMDGPLPHNSLLPRQTLHTFPNQHIHYPINHIHLPYMGTNLQPSRWGNDYALQNALMRSSSLHNLKHFNYVTDLTNKMVSRVVYQPLYHRFL